MSKKTTKRSYFCTAIFTLLTVVLYFLPIFITPCRAQDKVTWEQLPYYLESQRIKLKELPLIDAPEGLNESSANHNIIQIIANTLYEWNEYDFINDQGEIVRALSMQKPRKMFLSAAAAQALLTASSLWQQPSQKPIFRVPANTTSRAHLKQRKTRTFGISVIRQFSRQATDNRIRVGEKTTEYPYNTIAYLTFFSEGDPYTATGFLASESCLLTAGHNVYWPIAEYEAWSEQLTITPGQSQLQENTPLSQPYGSISSDNLYTNPYFPDAADLLTQPSEHDYACVILDQAFSGINTFMPLEFNALPARVKTAGYPPLVQGETNSQDMWFTSGAVLGTRGENEQIIDFDVYISGGHSGSPIWYYDEISQENRVIGIVTWKNGTSASGVRLTDMNKRFISEWLTMGSSDYKHTYYIPYFAVTESIWSGLALANHNNRENDIQIEYFAPDGSPAGSKIFTLEKYGQTAFPCAPNFAFGWVRISSSMPLYGLQLIGNLNPSTLFDIDMQASLNKKLILPHLAADGENWRSIAVFCNPNSVEAKITYTYYDPETGAATNATTTIPAWGSDIDELKERFGKDLNGGHILVQSTQPIAGFLLYDSSFTGENNWRAGLNAIPFTGK